MLITVFFLFIIVLALPNKQSYNPDSTKLVPGEILSPEKLLAWRQEHYG